MYFTVGWVKTYREGVPLQGELSTFEKYEEDDQIYSMSFNPLHSLLCVLSQEHISIWSVQHDGFHLELRRRIQRMKHRDTSNCLVWKASVEYSLLAVKVNESKMAIYRVHHPRMKSSTEKFSYNSENVHEVVPLKFNSLHATILMESSLNSDVDCSNYGTITCICTDQKNLIAGTSIGYILIISWSGEILQAISSDFIKKTKKSDEAECSVVSIDYKKRINLYALIFTDGTSAFLVQKKSSSDSFLSFDVVFHDENLDAVAIDMNPRQNLVAIGCRNSDVVVYHVVSDPNTQQYTFTQRSIVSFRNTRGFTEKELGSAHCVQFTSDGHALCVGYSHRGLAIFHPSGTCIMSTLPISADTFQYKRRNSSEKASDNEPFSCGVKSLAWDKEGYHLVAVPNKETVGLSACSFLEYSFYKSILCKNSPQNTNGIVLQGADRILLFHMTSGTDFVHADWDHLQLPYEYLVENYPLKFVSISSNGQQIAVAGRTGCALYNRMLRRWRMFGDLNQERATKSLGIVWIDNVVLAIIQKSTKQAGTELVLYPRHHLDKSSILSSFFVSKARVVHVSSTTVHIPVYDPQNGHLKRQVPLIFLYDALHHLHILIAKLSYVGKDVKAELSRLVTVDLSRKHKHTPLSMTSIQCFPDDDGHQSETTQILSRAKLLFHHSDRTLTALVLQNLPLPNRQKEVAIDTEVDMFWIESEKSYKNYCTFFTYHGSQKRGVKLSVTDLSLLGTDSPTSKILVHNLIPYDADACPLGPFKDAGIFLHASDSAVKPIRSLGNTGVEVIVPSVNYPYYEMQPKMYPYSHGILLSLLLSSPDPNSQKVQDTLVKFASKLPLAKSNKPTFIATLEWMFHCVLSVDDTITTAKSTDSSSSFANKFCIQEFIGSKDTLIPLQQGLEPVVKFIRNLAQFYEIVVNCLRKTDVMLWKRLFDLLDETPKEMFQKCLDKGLIHEAANMLRILQQTDELNFVKESSYKLLKPALNHFYYDLVRDMLRFIHMLEAEQELETDPTAKEQQLLAKELYGPLITGWLADNSRLQAIVSHHCRELMLDANLYAILRVVEILELPFTAWLELERDQSASLETDAEWEITFAKVHQVFDLPRSNFHINPHLARQTASKCSHMQNYQYFSCTQHRLFTIPEIVTQFEYLFKAFKESSCIEFALLLATILGKADCIVEIFSVSENKRKYWESYRVMLSHENNSGYASLHSFLSTQIN